MVLTKSGVPYLSTLRIGSASAPHKTFIIRTGTTRWHITTARWQSSTEPRIRNATTGRKHGWSSIYYIPSPATTDPSSIVAKLPPLLDTAPKNLSKVLFLASPGLAKWFEPNSAFCQDAVNRIFSSALTDRDTVESFVGIVDALPPPELFGEGDAVRTRLGPLTEGIAICLRSQPVHSVEKPPGSKRQGVLRFRSAHEIGRSVKGVRSIESDIGADAVTVTYVTVPLANTLFINGLHNTAFQQGWTKEGSSLRPQDHRRDLEELGIYATGIQHETTFDHRVPLYPLTTSREVLSSMGNVVREVKGDDGQPLKASAELEAMVPKVLAKQKERNEEVQIQIFAKAMPSSTDSGNPSDNIDFEAVSYGDTLTALHQQGRIYRVTSGGGGWGKKAGLLSLDPAINFEPLESTETSMFPDPDRTEDTLDITREVGALVPTGHFIQFFAARIQQPHPQYLDSTADTRTKRHEPAPETDEIVLGTLPSGDTHQPVDVQQHTEDALPFVMPDCFGALSEGGASVSLQKFQREQEDGTAQYQMVNEFRVDVPNATFKLVIPQT